MKVKLTNVVLIATCRYFAMTLLNVQNLRLGWMEGAVREAERALEEGEVPVGCVFVDDSGHVQAAGRNQTTIEHNATRHAGWCAFLWRFSSCVFV